MVKSEFLAEQCLLTILRIITNPNILFIQVRGVNAATTYFENFMPELTQFCNFVRKHFDKNSPVNDTTDASDVEKELSWLFNGRQLIEMFSLFDLADVVRFFF